MQMLKTIEQVAKSAPGMGGPRVVTSLTLDHHIEIMMIPIRETHPRVLHLAMVSGHSGDVPVAAVSLRWQAGL